MKISTLGLREGWCLDLDGEKKSHSYRHVGIKREDWRKEKGETLWNSWVIHSISTNFTITRNQNSPDSTLTGKSSQIISVPTSPPFHRLKPSMKLCHLCGTHSHHNPQKLVILNSLCRYQKLKSHCGHRQWQNPVNLNLLYDYQNSTQPRRGVVGKIEVCRIRWRTNKLEYDIYSWGEGITTVSWAFDWGSNNGGLSVLKVVGERYMGWAEEIKTSRDSLIEVSKMNSILVGFRTDNLGHKVSLEEISF